MHITESHMIDTTHHVETPEGVDLELRAAGPLLRGVAFGIDLLIRLIIYAIAALAFGWFAGGRGVLLIVIFITEWFYPVLFEVLNHGKTPGKHAMRLCVVCNDGTPVNWGSAVMRNLLRVVDSLPFISPVVPIPLYTFGLLSMLFSGQFRRLGDLAAGTLVVYDTGVSETTSLPHDIEPKPPPQRLSLNEQRALVGYAHRVGTFSTDRAAELAALASPLLRSVPETVVDDVRYLIGMGAWIVGHRPGGQKVNHRTGF